MDVLSFDGQVAIVTGAGRGVGRCHALELARRGANVVVNDLGAEVDGTGESSATAKSVVAEIEAMGGTAVASSDSVATPEGGATIVATAIENFGRLDILVNNAGILRDASFVKMTSEMVDPVIDVHLRGAFNVTLPAWKTMREQGYGRIVHTTSGSGLFGNFGQANYGAAKAGLIGLTRVLALEGGRYRIKVNAVAPIALTRMTEGVMNADLDMAPEHVAPVVAYLSHESCAVSGQIYHVGGGRVARVFLGVTAGFSDPNLSAEQVAEYIDQIDDPADFTIR